MKKHLLLAFCLMALCLAQNVWARVWDGKADSEWYWENPKKTEFTITTAAQLAGFTQLVNGGNDFSGKTIKLGASIMLNDTANWRNWGTAINTNYWAGTSDFIKPSNTWTPIGSYTSEDNNHPFSGTFDGGGYVISGIYINNSNDFLGLFGYVVSSATIKNLGVAASYVKGRNYLGGLVGWNGGTITNCFTTGNVIGSSSSLSDAIFVGGLIGWNSGTITDCYTTGNVRGSYGVAFISYVGGGLVGKNEGGTITNCYTTGNVEGNGGLVGVNTKGTITNCYATGDVEGNTIGGLVGVNDKSTIENSYATGNVKGGWQSSAGGLVGSNNEGTITNCYAMGNVNGGENGTGGLVGSNSGIITNCYAIGNVIGSTSGGLVGKNSNDNYYDENDENDEMIKMKGIIENSYATGNVSGKYSGGLAGSNSGMITNSYATGNVNGDEIGGGLVENNYGTINNSYAIGNVTGKTIGGLVGKNSSESTIMNCYAKGEVTGNTAGGLVGNNEEGTIESSYSVGNVKGTSNTNGGLVGVNSPGRITNSYYDRQTSGQSDIVKGEPKSTAQMKQQAIFQGWDFNRIWIINENNGYPYLQSIEKKPPVKYKYPQKIQQGNALTDKRDGNKYKTVVINTQTWMAENLNYNTKGSKCYENKPANCTKYGKLYDWSTANAVCPKGWHLPSNKEWRALVGFSGGDIAGNILKASSGWNDYGGKSGNGENVFGFSALPGGLCNADGAFFGVSNYGHWWTTTNNVVWSISYGGNIWNTDNAADTNLFSVRCVQD